MTFIWFSLKTLKTFHIQTMWIHKDGLWGLPGHYRNENHRSWPKCRAWNERKYIHLTFSPSQSHFILLFSFFLSGFPSLLFFGFECLALKNNRATAKDFSASFEPWIPSISPLAPWLRPAASVASLAELTLSAADELVEAGNDGEEEREKSKKVREKTKRRVSCGERGCQFFRFWRAKTGDKRNC